jgi:hypothetical protein
MPPSSDRWKNAAAGAPKRGQQLDRLRLLLAVSGSSLAGGAAEPHLVVRLHECTHP